MANASTTIEGLLGKVDISPEPMVRGVTVLEDGKARSDADLEAALKKGFAPAQTIYERGTAVVQAGVNNARRYHLEWEKMPLVSSELCDRGIARVESEMRKDVIVNARDLQMDKDGNIVHHVAGLGKVSVPVEEKAISGLCQRAGIPHAGGYFKECWPELRARNWNQWSGFITSQDEAKDAEVIANGGVPEPRAIKLRTRRGADGRRGIYGAVSPTYTAYDVDKILAAIKLATPEGARGKLVYDGHRASVDVLFSSNVAPEDYVCGEFFRGGVKVFTADDGSGSIGGYSLLWQNLCLNLAIIDKAKTGLFRIRHVGNVEALAAKFKNAFKVSLERLEHFTKRWGFAVRENVVAQVQRADEEAAKLDVDEVFPGIFRGLLDHELSVIKGNHETVVEALMDCWQQDESSARKIVTTSRAAVVNAVTRYAHTVNQDPWLEEELAQIAGQLAWSNKPLPFAAK